MHNLDFDESECDLICFALKRRNESINNAISIFGNTESELAHFALAYSDVIDDLLLEVNQRDSFTASEIKMIYNALKQLPKTDKNVEYLIASITDYCNDFDIELP